MPFRPLNTQNSTTSNYSQVNDMVRQLNKEAVTKTFKQANGNAIVNGKYAEGRYGIVFYDDDGVPSVLIGQAPDDGRMGIWQAKPGQNVITLLGG